MTTDDDRIVTEPCPQEPPTVDVPGIRSALLLVLGMALVLGSLLWWAQSTPSGRRATGKPAVEYVVPPPPVHKAVPGWNAVAPAPKLTKGKARKGMCTWVASDAGNTDFNGTYSYDSTHNGQPAYSNPAGKHLWYDGTMHGPDMWRWVLSAAIDSITADYLSTGDTLPSTWITDGGTPDAPTLEAGTGGTTVDPYIWPYTYHWWEDADAPYYPPPTPLKPCRCTIGGVAYVAFPYQQASPNTRGFSLYGLVADEWLDCPADNDLYSATTYDAYQSGACFDAGDGTHLITCSGVYLDGATYKCDWTKWDIVPGTSATRHAAATVVVMPSLDVSNPVEISAGVYRFMALDGTSWKLCEYTFGDAAYSVIATYSSVTPLPSGYTAVVLGGTAALDQVLFRATNGALYWMRHCKNTVDAHRVAVHEVNAGGCTQLGDVVACGYTDYLQDYGNYTAFDCVVGDLGTDAAHRAALRWSPGQSSIGARPFSGPGGAIMRAWYLDGTPLLVAGWAAAVFDTRPFVLEAAPKEVNLPLATVNLTAYAPAAPAKSIDLPTTTVNVTAYPCTVSKVRIIELPCAHVNVTALAPTVVGQANRTPGASTVVWDWVRVSSG